MNTKIIYHAGWSWQLYNVRLPLMSAMKDRGFSVLACGPEDEFRPLIERAGVGFRHVQTSLHGVNPVVELRVIAALWRLYRREKPHVVHHFALKPAIYGSIAARLAGVPVIVNTVTGLGFAFQVGGALERLVRILWRIGCGRRTWTIFQNPDNLKLFLEAGLVDADRTRLIRGSGVDCRRFAPAPEANARTDRAPVRFLMFGRLLRDKGVLEYLEAARIVRERMLAAPGGISATFVLLGGAPAGNPTGVREDSLTNPATISPSVVQDYVKKGLIEYHPHDEDVLPHIHAADVVVLPSYGEGLPRSLLEALACGKPVITTKAPGCREVVQHLENGVLVQPRSADDLASAFEYVLAHTRGLRKMGEVSRRLAVESFSDEVVVSQVIETYRTAGLTL
jgi:glycosyltransferase involved in cell wall biosynthesis